MAKLIKVTDKLWKIKILKELREASKEMGEGQVIRNEVADIDRAIRFIEYGFEEGLKYSQTSEEAKANG